MTGGKRTYIRRIAFIGLLVVLLFAVLSTATYAWYSANNVVGAGVVTFKSSSSDGGGFLTIGKTKTTDATELTFDKTTQLSPMIPISDGVVGTTRYEQFLSFNNTYEGLDGAGQLVAVLTGMATTPLVLAVDGQKYFYINNINTESAINVKVDYTVSGELSEKLHVAMFIGEAAADAQLAGIISGSGVIHYGRIKANELVAKQPTMQNAYKPSGAITFTVPSGDSVCIRLVAWLDGVDMKNENGSKNTSFAMTFSEAI